MSSNIHPNRDNVSISRALVHETSGNAGREVDGEGWEIRPGHPAVIWERIDVVNRLNIDAKIAQQKRTRYFHKLFRNVCPRNS